MHNTSPEPLSSLQATPTAEAATRSSELHRWERVCWLIALGLGLLQAWGRRHDSVDGLAYMGADGISYLDIGDAYMRGDWDTALNAMWSPFYSWLLGVTLQLFKPSPFWEFTVVRLLNFLIYAAALFSFAFFLRALRRDRSRKHSSGKELPDWSWLVFGYTIFVWTSLLMNRVSRTSPDLLVAALIFLSCALLLRMRTHPTRWQLFVALGLVLGIGYLTKTVMFPLAFVFLTVAFLLTQRRIGSTNALLRVTLSLLIFLMLALPFIVALSRARDRFTIGDSARLNYAWYVNKVTPFIHWQGEPPGSGTPVHPTRRIFPSPAVYEFATPVGGTYPLWYDPSYWYEGVTPHFNLRQQLAAIARNLTFLYGFLFYRFFLVAVLFALFILFYQTGRKWMVVRDIGAYWFLIAPSIIAVSLYLLINIEPRYLAPFVPVLALSLFAAVQLSAIHETRRLLSGVSLAVVLVFFVSILPITVRSAYSTVRDLLPGRAAARDVQWQVADGLQRMGLRPGDPVAAVGKTMFAAWPRLARVRVVAEIAETDAGDSEKFWSANEELTQQTLAAFASTGARVVVADKVPRWAMSDKRADKWQRIGNTDHYVYFLLP